MQQQPEQTLHIPYTENICFWSEGELASSAYKRIKRLRRSKHPEYAEAMLSEWIIE